jgi:hypothetical protein
MVEVLDPFKVQSDKIEVKDPFLTDEDEKEDDQPTQEEIDAISTQMYKGMSMEEANEYYRELLKNPNVTPPPLGLGYAIYVDPETGRREYFAKPSPRTGKSLLDAGKKVLQGDFSGAAEAITNPEARVSGIDKVAMGLGESFGGLVETGAAAVEKTTGLPALDAVDSLVNQVDTGDSFTDAMLTDAVPAAIAAIGTGGAVTTAVKGYPLLIRALATVGSAEIAASATTSTEEGTLLLGEGALLPIANGIDFGDENADQILEQRLNVLGEGLALNSLIGGVAPVGAKVVELAGKFAFLPLYTVISGGSAMEKRIYERIANQLATIDGNTTPEQLMAKRREIAEIIKENKDVILPRLEEMDADPTLTLDTISALMRGTDDPEMRAQAASLLAGQLQRGSKSPKTIAAVEKPQAQLQSDMEMIMKEAGGETATEQTQTMAAGADVLAGQARDYVEGSQSLVNAARDRFDAAADRVVKGFEEDLEFGQQIEKLEDLVGTEITKGQGDSFETVREGLKTAYGNMTDQKDALYGAIPEGTPFDYEGFGMALREATENLNAFDDSGTQVLGNRLIQTIRSAYGKTEPITSLDAFGGVVDSRQAIPIEAVIKEIAESGVDFKVLYNDIRPEISKLINDAYSNGRSDVGEKLRLIKKAIDDQVTWIADNGGEVGEEAAAAALQAKDYYEGYAKVWRDGGKMEEFGDLYDPVHQRNIGEAGFRESSSDLITDVLSGRNADAVLNMKTAIDQVGGNSNAIADYMISDVINGFASEVRKNNLTGANLAAFSDNLRQYAASLNKVFPDKAESINNFIRNVEAAAGNKEQLEAALEAATQRASDAKKIVKQSEFGSFLRKSLGKELETTADPYQAFVEAFQRDGGGILKDLKESMASLPQAQQEVVQAGMETAYMRLLRKKVQAARQEAGGSQSLKLASIEGMLKEEDQMLEAGRLIFEGKPELFNGVTNLLEVAGMISRGKGAQPVAAMSPTAFNTEATQATNRLIMIAVGPLTRAGARIRAFAGGAFDALDPTKRAEIMLDNILSDPDKFIELSRRYDIDPMDLATKQNLITGLTTGFIKGLSGDLGAEGDGTNLEQQMMELLP